MQPLPFSIFAMRAFVLAGVIGLAACSQPAVRPPRSEPAAAAVKAVASFGANDVDAALRAAWQRAGVVPAARVDDATFLRRVYLDLVGTVPPLDVTTTFLSDPSVGKRAKLVDTLLASSEYAEHWATYWDDVLMGQTAKSNLVDRDAFRDWLRARFAANASWDRITAELVSATGQNSLGVPKGRAREREEGEGDASAVNGAVNWTLRLQRNPPDLGGTAARVFLGVQIQCAQCHDHKTESWKQTDFQRFTKPFLHAKVDSLDAVPMKVKRVVLVDAARPPPRLDKNAELAPIARAKATALDGTDLERGPDTRKALAAWMTAKTNPWFAKAFVNRMWGHFLGRGFHDPVDDIRPSNPAMEPALLDRIAADFVAHDFDIKALLRLICASEAYQLASASPAKTDPENKLWGRFHLVPLGPEELLNSIFRVTELDKSAERAGIKDLDALRASIVRQYAFLFDVDEEDDAPDYSGTVSQALTLLNGALVGQGARALPASPVLALVSAGGTDAEKVDALTMRVLARHATPDERERWVAYIRRSEVAPSEGAGSPTQRAAPKQGPLAKLANRRVGDRPKQAAYEDLLWALLNSSEFTFNH